MKTASSSNAPSVAMKQRIMQKFSFVPYGEVSLPVVVLKSKTFPWNEKTFPGVSSVKCGAEASCAFYGFLIIIRKCCTINCWVSEIVFLLLSSSKINQQESFQLGRKVFSIDTQKKTKTTSKSICSFIDFKGDHENDGMTLHDSVTWFRQKSMQTSLTWSQWHSNIGWLSWQSIVKRLATNFSFPDFWWIKYFTTIALFDHFSNFSLPAVVEINSLLSQNSFDSIIFRFPINYTIRWEAKWSGNEKGKKLNLAHQQEKIETSTLIEKTLLVLLNQFVILNEKQKGKAEKHKKRLKHRVFFVWKAVIGEL